MSGDGRLEVAAVLRGDGRPTEPGERPTRLLGGASAPVGERAAQPVAWRRQVLRTLGLMSELSPHYLRRFLAHTETLLWLEQAQAQLKPAAAGKGGAAKTEKSTRQKK
jgi:hypothetical protein